MGPADLPSEIITSVRCLVLVRNQIVICQTPDGSWHPWPGGRREPGETYEETAYREVHEETGWLLDESSMEPIGWLHLEHLATPPDDYPFPHPDFLQVVLLARSTSRDGGPESSWTDTEGYELGSQLVGVHAARILTSTTDMPAAPFLDFLAKREE
jgi:8-oxo-dGTP pyrophosphatase MutT (NUDIX family)